MFTQFTSQLAKFRKSAQAVMLFSVALLTMGAAFVTTPMPTLAPSLDNAFVDLFENVEIAQETAPRDEQTIWAARLKESYRNYRLFAISA